jgi:hypothetical protein
MSTNNGNTDSQNPNGTAAVRKAALTEKLELKTRRVMKRCFMTGKQCKFSSHVTEHLTEPTTGRTGTSPDQLKREHNPNVFVVMPFSPNLETFYRWSLRPYLVEGHGLPDESVQRADEVRDIGYIICEKICRRVQEADLVLADISLSNANVFYEIGLAFGLERPIVFMHNEKDHEPLLSDHRIAQSLNLPTDEGNQKNKLLKYPGVGALDLSKEDYHLDRYVLRPPRLPRPARKLSICMLRTEKSPPEAKSDSDRSHERRGRRDITLNFPEVIGGAVGVAMAQIRSEAKEPKPENKPAWQQVVATTAQTEWQSFASLVHIAVDGKESFEKIAARIEESFGTVIDVSGSDVVAYFWLGYCHARGLNAIPVYRQHTGEPSDTERQLDRVAIASLLQGELAKLRDLANTMQHRDKEKLAFDIHALWYAEYEDEKPYEFKTKIREILEHLLERDLPDRQKRAFWDRFPAELPMKLFTGAVHIGSLNREMIGDWDLRTVSRLYSYLPSVREAMAIELVSPMYSPEQAYMPLRTALTSRPADTEEFLKGYRDYIGGQLKGTNAIVIASPDVNPVTEYVLHRIYRVKQPLEPFGSSDFENEFNGYVVVKELEKTPANERATGERGQSDLADRIKFPRLFYQESGKGELFGPSADSAGAVGAHANRRGFAVHCLTQLFTHDPKLFEEYRSQGEEGQGTFTLLGHLVVAPTPGHGNATGDAGLVVLLNGVSGPATFALAQVLTGGGRHGGTEVNAKSEAMLKKINDALDASGWVEAIVAVEVTTRMDKASPTYLDSREPVTWDFLKTDKGDYGPPSKP